MLSRLRVGTIALPAFGVLFGHGSVLADPAIEAAPAQSTTRGFEYPCSKVRVIVSLPAGNSTDGHARVLAQRLAERTGKSFYVENMPGTFGSQTALHLMKTMADGCTIAILHNGALIAEPLYGTQSWSVSNFVPISAFAYSTLVFVVHESVPVHSLEEFERYARSRRVNIAASASSTTIAAAMMAKRLGGETITVPFKTEMEAVHQVSAGDQVCCMFAMLATTRGMIESGKFRVLAVVDTKRSALLPHVPAITESYPEFENASLAPLSFFIGPPGFPDHLRDYLSRMIREILAEEGVRQRLLLLSGEPAGSTPEWLGDYFARETPRWRSIVHAAGLSKE